MDKIKNNYLQRNYIQDYGCLNILIYSVGVLGFTSKLHINFYTFETLGLLFNVLLVMLSIHNQKTQYPYYVQLMVNLFQIFEVIVFPQLLYQQFIIFQYIPEFKHFCALAMAFIPGLMFCVKFYHFILMSMLTSLCLLPLVDMKVNLLCCYELIASIIIYSCISYLVYKNRAQIDKELKNVITKETQQKYFLSLIAQPFCLIDFNKRIIFSNKMFQELYQSCSGTGLSRNSSIDLMIKDDSLPKLKQMLNTALQDFEPKYFDVTLKSEEKCQSDKKESLASISMLDQLSKTIQKGINFLTQGMNQFSDNQWKLFASISIQPINWKSNKAAIVVIYKDEDVQMNHHLESYLVYQLKNKLNNLLLIALYYVKWDNLRAINIIKESDLKLLSNSIIELNLIINMIQMFDLETLHSLHEYPRLNFNVRNFVVQKIEVFCAKHLEAFNFIDLGFEETLPNDMNGEVGQLSIVLKILYQLFFCILETIAMCVSDLKNKQELTINQINSERVKVDTKDAYIIMFQFVWIKQTTLDKIMQVFIGKDPIEAKVIQKQEDYLQMITQKPLIVKLMSTIKKITDLTPYSDVSYEIEDLKSQLTLKMLFKVVEQKHTYRKSLDQKDDSSIIYVLNMPSLQLTFARESQNNNHYQWKPRPQQKAHLLKESVQRQVRSMPAPGFVRLNSQATTKAQKTVNQSQPGSTNIILLGSIDSNMKKSDYQREKKVVSDKCIERQSSLKEKKSHQKKENLIQPLFEEPMKQQMKIYNQYLVAQIEFLLKKIILTQGGALDGVSYSIVSSQDNHSDDIDDSEKIMRTTYSEQGNSPILSKLIEFKSPQISRPSIFNKMIGQRPNKSPYFMQLVGKQLNNQCEQSKISQKLSLPDSNKQQQHRKRHQNLMRSPQVQKNLIAKKFKIKYQPLVSVDVSDDVSSNTSMQEFNETALIASNSLLQSHVNKDRNETQTRRWSYREEDQIEPIMKSDTILTFIQSRLYSEMIDQVVKQKLVQPKTLIHAKDVKQFMSTYLELSRKGSQINFIIFEMAETCVQHYVEILLFINTMETKIHLKSTIICICQPVVIKKIGKVADHCFQVPFMYEDLCKTLVNADSLLQ